MGEHAALVEAAEAGAQRRQLGVDCSALLTGLRDGAKARGPSGGQLDSGAERAPVGLAIQGITLSMYDSHAKNCARGVAEQAPE